MATVIKKSKILVGSVFDKLPKIPSESIHCCMTSPPYYGLRDYGQAGQIGLEQTPDAYVARLVEVFREVRRVLRDDGTLWLNLGDSYASGGSGGSGPKSTLRGCTGSHVKQAVMNRNPVVRRGVAKQLLGIPWRVAFALQSDGWYLRQEIIWHKPNPLPESMDDRCVKSHESVFLLTKRADYFFDQVAIDEPAVSAGKLQRFSYESAKARNLGKEPTGNGRRDAIPVNCPETRIKRSVWTIPTKPFRGSHFATFPKKLVEPCILAGTSARGCCPSCGSPHKRVIEKVWMSTAPGTDSKVKDDMSKLETGNRDKERHVTTRKTVGWEPTCSCGIETTLPCAVLDPFFGAGTVGVVALMLSRLYVGVELNPEYAEMAQRRIDHSPGGGFGLIGR